MGDRFDDEAMRLWALARHEDWRIEDAPAWREEWEPTAAALRYASEEAERRGELKALDWVMQVFWNGSNFAERRQEVVARIAELKKGGTDAPLVPDARSRVVLGLSDEPCPSCGKFSRVETAGCDHCEYEEK